MKPCSVFSRSLVNVLSYFHNLKNKNEREKQKKCKLGGLPWWSRGKEFTSQCRGHGFNPWLGNYDPTCHGATKSSHYIEDPVQPKKKKERKHVNWEDAILIWMHLKITIIKPLYVNKINIKITHMNNTSQFMKTNSIFPNKSFLVKWVALFYISSSFFSAWLKRRQPDSHTCIQSVVIYYVDKFEDKRASHRHAVGRQEDLNGISDHCRFFFLTLHQISACGHSFFFN